MRLQHPGRRLRPRRQFSDFLRQRAARALASACQPGFLPAAEAPTAFAGYVEVAARRLETLLGPQIALAWQAARVCRQQVDFAGFLDSLEQTGLERMLADAPLLAGCESAFLAEWSRGWGALLGQLERDRAGLVSAGLLGRQARLREIRGPLSDFHLHRTALRLIFDSGESLLYKPRDGRAEQTLYAIARQIIPQAASWPAMLATQDATWVRWVTAEPLRRGATAGVGEQLGAILCLGHLFRISDLHQANLLLHRQSVVPVDLETAFQPAPTSEGWSDLETKEAVSMGDCLLHTGLLSASNFDRDRGEIRNFATIGRWKRQRFPVEVRQLANDDFGGLEWAPRNRWSVNRFSALWCEDATADLAMVESIVRGFLSTAELAASKKAEIAEAAASLPGLPVRELARNSCYYGVLIDAFLQSPYEEVVAEIEEELGRVPDVGAILWLRQREELASVLSAETPRFTRLVTAAELARCLSNERLIWQPNGRLRLAEQLSRWILRAPRLIRRAPESRS